MTALYIFIGFVLCLLVEVMALGALWLIIAIKFTCAEDE
jgi:hypothetical protein